MRKLFNYCYHVVIYVRQVCNNVILALYVKWKKNGILINVGHLILIDIDEYKSISLQRVYILSIT